MTLPLFDRIAAPAAPSDCPVLATLIASLRAPRSPTHHGGDAWGDFDVQAAACELLAVTRAPDARVQRGRARLLRHRATAVWAPAALALVAERIAFGERPARPAPPRVLALGEHPRPGDELARYATHAARTERRCELHQRLVGRYGAADAGASALAAARDLARGLGGASDLDAAVESYAARAFVNLSLVAERAGGPEGVARNAGAFLALVGRLHGGVHLVGWALSGLARDLSQR